MLFSASEIASLQPSKPVVILLGDYNTRYADAGMRLYYSPELADQRDESIRVAYNASIGSHSILRRATVLEVFCNTCSINIQPDDYLLGTLAYNGPCFRNGNPVPGYACTTGHIVHDYQSLLEHGISGLQKIVGSAPAEFTYQNHARLAYLQALEALGMFVRRHTQSVHEDSPIARNHLGELNELCEKPPATFFGAIQLLWFAHILLHIENPSVAISFGRIDQYLNPFLEFDLVSGRTTLQDAFDLLCVFMLKCSEGEESQNAVVGGAGQENLVSYLMLSAMKSMRTIQPSICVRIGRNTSDEFLDACTDLSVQGTGNPGFMNEDLVTQSLINTGVQEVDAVDWSVVGCYEATVSGKCYPNTVLGRLNLPRLLTQYIAGIDSMPTSFEALVGDIEIHIISAYCDHLLDVKSQWVQFRNNAPSPFGSVLMVGSREKLVPVECGGAPYNFVGINLLGLGSLVDGLLAIKHTIYDTSWLNLAALKENLASNFADDSVRTALRNHHQRNGSDDVFSQDLTRHVSTSLARMVLDSRIRIESDELGPFVEVQPYPAFFGFAADIYDTDFASVDGRKAGELISYGVAPPLSSFTSSTAALMSASHAAQCLAACGSPFALTLSETEADPELIAYLVKTYFAAGGFHLHLNIADSNILKDTIIHPEQHQDLMVRVSGFSAKFVTLDKKWQEALIERAEKGC